MKSSIGISLVVVVLGLASGLNGCTRGENEEGKVAVPAREHIVQTQDSLDRVKEDLAQAREDVGQASDDLTGRARALADRAAEKSERLAEKLDGELSEVRDGLPAVSGDSRLDLSSLFENLSSDQDLSVETVKNRLAWGVIVLEGEVQALKDRVATATYDELTQDLEDMALELRELGNNPDSELQEAVASIQTKGRKLAVKMGEIKAELP